MASKMVSKCPSKMREGSEQEEEKGEMEEEEATLQGIKSILGEERLE